MTDALVVQNTKLFKDENELLKKYQDVLVQSILTSFGLDALFFGGTDQVGGTVDTARSLDKEFHSQWKTKAGRQAFADLQNLDALKKELKNNPDTASTISKRIKKAEDVKRAVFKNERNSDKYERGELYDSKQCHDQNQNYRKRKSSTDPKDNISYMTGKPIEGSRNLDHIVSASEVHHNPVRRMANNSTADLVNSDSNLAFASEYHNKSKGEKSADHWIADRENQARGLRRKEERQGSLSEKDGKDLSKLESLDKEAQDRTVGKYNEEGKKIYKKNERGMYSDKNFYLNMGEEALKSGVKMGLRQTLGLVLFEVWKEVRDVFPLIIADWRQCDGWREKLDLRPALKRFSIAMRNAVSNVKRRWRDIFSAMGGGVLSGILGSLTTSIINIIEETGLRFMRLVRNFWSSIVGAVRILRDDSYATPQEKTLAVMRLLSVGVAGVLQPIISECVDKFLLPYLPDLPGKEGNIFRTILSEFAGAFCSGMISVTLVYFIDRSPIVQKLLTMAGDVVANAVKLVGKGIGSTVEYAQKSVEMASTILTSPASYALSMTLNPLMGQVSAIRSEMAAQTKLLEGVDGKLDEQTALLHRQDTKLDGLGATMAAGFERLDQGIKIAVAIGNQLLDGQQEIKEQLDLLRKEVAKGVQDIRNDIVGLEERTLVHEFKTHLYLLEARYRKCVEAVSEKDSGPSSGDLERTIAAAETFAVWLKERAEALGEVGNVKRFPVLSARVMALQMEIDVRRFREPDYLLPCRGECEELLHTLRAEIRYHTAGSLFDQLDEGRSFLVEQYVLLQRAMKAALKEAGHLQWDVAANDGPFLANPELFAWNDGLNELRQLVAEAGNVQPGAEPVVLLKISSDEERQAYQDYLPVEGDTLQLGALKAIFGIPEHVHLNSSMAFGLLNEGRRIKAAHGRALNTELAA